MQQRKEACQGGGEQQGSMPGKRWPSTGGCNAAANMVRALASACSPCLHSLCSAALRAACSPCLYPHACLLTCRHACHPIKFSSPPHARALSLFPGRNLSLARPLQEHCGGASSLNPMPCMHPQSRASPESPLLTRARSLFSRTQISLSLLLYGMHPLRIQDSK